MGSPPVPLSHSYNPILVDRESYIGASQAADLVNQPNYRKGCARAVGYEKKRVPPDIRPDQNTAHAITLRATMRRGHFLEDLVAQLYTEATGRKVIRSNHLIRHPDHPGAGVHVDRIILAIDDRGRGDLELKTHNQGVFLNLLRNGLPTGHMLQLQWCLWVTGHKWGSFGVLGVFAEMPFRHFDLSADPAWHDIFARACDEFWNTLARNELPPRLPDPNDARCRVCPWRLTCRGQMIDAVEYQQMLQEQQGRKKVLKEIHNHDLDELLTDRALIQGELEELSHSDPETPGAYQVVTRRIKELIGDEEALLVNQHWRLYQYETKWSGLDIARLRMEQPELFEKYYISGRPTGGRTLRVYPVKKGE